eukprot:566026-Alexandrium_andersonii.AAC.1
MEVTSSTSSPRLSPNWRCQESGAWVWIRLGRLGVGRCGSRLRTCSMFFRGGVGGVARAEVPARRAQPPRGTRRAVTGLRPDGCPLLLARSPNPTRAGHWEFAGPPLRRVSQACRGHVGRGVGGKQKALPPAGPQPVD